MKSILQIIKENFLIHDKEKLKRKILTKILKGYPDNFKFIDYVENSFYIEGKHFILDKLYSDKELNKLLLFFGYYISSLAKDDNNNEIGRLFIEPRNSSNMTDYVYNTCDGICYHITLKENLKYILNSGLRPRIGKYRRYPFRIFLYCTETNIKNDSNFKALIDRIIGKRNIDEYVCLQIDLSKLKNKITIMKDTAMHITGAVYTDDIIDKAVLETTNYLDYYK